MNKLKFHINIPVWFWIFLNLSQVSFIALKLFNIISWNWFWVLSPLWFFMGLVYIIWFICSITLFFKWIKR